MSTVAVVALGKIGLPLAVAIAEGGHQVIGADTSSSVVGKVSAGIPPFPNEAGLDRRLDAVVRSGALVATTDTAQASAGSSVVVIVVPLLVDDEADPDFTAIDAATARVGSGLQPGTLVVYETTLPVRTTRERFAPALADASGLSLGTDLFVAHSPERVFSGRVFADLSRYPKLVGGVDATSGTRAVEFYESFLHFDDRSDLERPNGVWDLGSSDAAEMAKLAETTYRDLNIAYANQLALGAESLGIDVYRVIEACNSQPFSHIHTPGIAVGGHCIPVYPHLLTRSVPEVSLAQAGRHVNAGMPEIAAEQVGKALGGLDGAKVTILGLSFRGGVKEHGFSGTLVLASLFDAAGATTTVVDPLYGPDELINLGLRPHEPGSSTDAVVLQAAHGEFRDASSEQFPGVRVVYDGRGWLQRRLWPGTLFLRLGNQP